MKNFLPLVLALFLLPLASQAAFSATSGFKIQKAGEELVLFGTNTRVEKGEYYKKLVVFGGELEFHGTAEECTIFGGHVHFAPGSEVKKTLVVFGGAFDRDNGAKVAGDRVEFRTPGVFYRLFLSLLSVSGDIFQGALFWLGLAFFTVVVWIFGLVLRALFPKYLRQSEERLFSDIFLNGAWGVLGAIAFLPGMLFLLISLIGIPLLPLYVALYFLSYLFAHIVIAARLGAYSLKKQVGEGNAWSLLFGLTILHLLYLLPLSYLCFLLMEFVAWGACWRAWRARRRAA